MASKQTAMDDTRVNTRCMYVESDQLYETVVDEYTISDFHVVRQFRVSDRYLAAHFLILVHQRHIVAGLERYADRELTDANPWALKIAQYGDRLLHRVGDLADHANPFRVVNVRSVRKVKPGNIHSRFCQRCYRVERRSSRTKGADNFCATDVWHQFPFW
jgi:hypothetical protein